jgi:hypothetical protein
MLEALAEDSAEASSLSTTGTMISMCAEDSILKPALSQKGFSFKER